MARKSRVICIQYHNVKTACIKKKLPIDENLNTFTNFMEYVKRYLVPALTDADRRLYINSIDDITCSFELINPDAGIVKGNIHLKMKRPRMPDTRVKIRRPSTMDDHNDNDNNNNNNNSHTIYDKFSAREEDVHQDDLKWAQFTKKVPVTAGMAGVETYVSRLMDFIENDPASYTDLSYNDYSVDKCNLVVKSTGVITGIEIEKELMVFHTSHPRAKCEMRSDITDVQSRRYSMWESLFKSGGVDFSPDDFTCRDDDEIEEEEEDKGGDNDDDDDDD